MITYFVKLHNKIMVETDTRQLMDMSYDEILWIDLIDPTDSERSMVESYLNISLQSSHRVEEIESSSRYYEVESAIFANTSFLSIDEDGGFHGEPVSFVLAEGILVSQRNGELRTFSDTVRKLTNNSKVFPTCFHVLVALLETRVDLDADMVENNAKEIAVINKTLNIEHSNAANDSEILLDINRLQENTMLIRENIIDKQRVLSNILRSNRFPSDTEQKLSMILKDVSSLISHTDFGFERLEFLQDTFMGLVNIEQNKIIKVFTVASVVFMPPTLIASIYGMNFRILPELEWKLGYPFAIVLMILSTAVILYIFKRKKLL